MSELGPSVNNNEYDNVSTQEEDWLYGLGYKPDWYTDESDRTPGYIDEQILSISSQDDDLRVRPFGGSHLSGSV